MRAVTARAASLLLPAALALAPGRPRADDSNFRPYLVGARAAGMGGAFTALADDGSGPFYNPAGIAFVERSQLSIAGSVYGIVSGTQADAIVVGAERHDFSFHNLNTFPTATAGVWKLGDGSRPDRADVLSLGVFIPDAVNVDARDTIVSRENAIVVVNQEQTMWLGLTYAHRAGSVGVGATIFGLLGTGVSQLDLTGVGATSADFILLTLRTDETRYGVVGALGIRWDATDHLRLGLSIFSPAYGRGSRRLFVRAAGAGAGAAGGPPAIAVVNEDGLHATPTEPLRVQAGLAYTSGPFTLAADAVVLGPRDVRDDSDRVDIGAERHVVRNAVVNGSVGFEYVIAERFPLRAGFFTDLAASPATSAGSDVQDTAHVNRFGGSLSIGYRTEHTATDLGVNLSGGSGQDVVPGDNLDFTNLKVSRSSQLLFYVFLATAYQF